MIEEEGKGAWLVMIQVNKGSVLIPELLYNCNRVCVYLLGWEVGVMRWMAHDSEC